jgi:hypothetical protein
MELFLPNNLTLSEALKSSSRRLPEGAKRQGILYRPSLLAQVEIRFFQRKYDLDYDMKRTALVFGPDRRGRVHWEDHLINNIDSRSLDRQPSPEARFTTIEPPLTDSKTIKSMQSDFAEWGYRETEVIVWSNEKLEVYAGPPNSEGDFRKMCSEAAREKRDEEIKKTEASFKKKINTLKKRMSREKRELSSDEAEYNQRKMEELGTHAENILGLFSGRKRRISTSLSKRRMTEKAKADIDESKDAIDEMEKELADLARDIENAIDDIEDRWGEIAGEVDEIPISPYKKDVLIDLFGVAWMPYHLVEVEGRFEELPGFEV